MFDNNQSNDKWFDERIKKLEQSLPMNWLGSNLAREAQRERMTKRVSEGWQSICKELENKIEKLKEENTELITIARCHEEENEQLKAENNKWRNSDAISDNTRLIFKIMSERGDYQQATQMLEQENEQLKIELDNSNGQYAVMKKKLNAENEQLKAENEQLKFSMAIGQHQKVHTTKDWNDLRDENARLKQEVERLQEKNKYFAEVFNDRSEISDESDKLREEVEELIANRNTFIARNQLLAKQYSELSKELEALKHWKESPCEDHVSITVVHRGFRGGVVNEIIDDAFNKNTLLTMAQELFEHSGIRLIEENVQTADRNSVTRKYKCDTCQDKGKVFDWDIFKRRISFVDLSQSGFDVEKVQRNYPWLVKDCPDCNNKQEAQTEEVKCTCMFGYTSKEDCKFDHANKSINFTFDIPKYKHCKITASPLKQRSDAPNK